MQFCHKHSIVLLADEVYQANTYYPETRPFHSFKKVCCDMSVCFGCTSTVVLCWLLVPSHTTSSHGHACVLQVLMSTPVICNELELVSFHSVSKGVIGEV